MRTKAPFEKTDVYLPDFKFEQVAGRSLGFLSAGIFIIFLTITLFQLFTGHNLIYILEQMPIFDFLFFLTIFYAAYFFVIQKKKKLELAIKAALQQGEIIEVIVTEINLQSATETRGRQQDSDFGNQSPAFNQQSFHTIKARYQSQTLTLPHIPFAIAKQLNIQQTVKALYHSAHPEFAFLLKEEPSSSR